MGRRRSKLPLFLFIVVIAGAGAWWWLKAPQAGGAAGATGGKAQAGKDAPVSIRVASAGRRDAPLEIKAVGTVVPRQSVAVRSRIDSQITAVKFHDGDLVKAGDTLFTLDSRALEAQLAQAQATLLGDKAQVESLQAQYDRAKKGVDTGFSSQSILDDAKGALDAKKAAAQADEAAARNLQTQIGYAVIRAPIDGRTGTINITLGNNVKANDTEALVTINQVQPIFVQISLPQDDFESVRGAMNAGTVAASASRSGGAEIGQGTLAYIDNAIDAGTGTFTARAIFANEDEKLWPGMLVDLTVILGEDKQALVIPSVAVQHDGGGDYVFAIADGKAAKKPVTVQRIQGDWAIIGQGIEDNAQVAVDGLMSLKDGAVVTLIADKKADKNAVAPDVSEKPEQRAEAKPGQP